ncbi:glycoside hydrolase superfamily [Xylaria sp. FL0064]|nr:glycoside hydrolase superfamily [Xylaria sp. FL0064]
MHSPSLSAWAIALLFASFSNAFRNVMYIDLWHSNLPTNRTITAGITHVIMAFVDPKNFSTTEYLPSPPLMSVQDVRSYFDNGTKVGIALGGWGDYSASFSLVSTKENRTDFSTNLANWMQKEDYDFVDIDWEYPGGNGALATPDPTAEIENFPPFLEAVKTALKPGKGISLAVAATPVGMAAFKSPEQAKPIWDTIDFVTVMTYDYVNRASKMTGHHTDVEGPKLAVQRYIDLGLSVEKINLGFAFYAKYFAVDDGCDNFTVPDACSIVPAQYPNGTDNYKSGVLTYESRYIDPQPVPTLQGVNAGGICGYNNTLTSYNCADSNCCSDYGYCGSKLLYCLGNCQVGFGRCDGPDTIASFKKARENFKYDEVKGEIWYFDETTSPKLFWTWENTDLMSRKFDEIVNNPAHKLGGISGWSLGENTAGWEHVQQMQNMTHLRSSEGQDDECPQLP